MKLKRLEINGFKSFSEKTVIDFHPGISAIVGPNGCGKSNVVDALRWVMGEQSVKQLRGKSMEDVIFAGANEKPPLNLAEVSLTIANDNGTIPEELRDFTEINLTRRLFRSGESGYFINKRPCRLKDIHNIFLGSGAGSKSYSVIQQGSIGEITEANPEERRFFIEEAAGTTRYKSHKNEALRKIQTTNQNLLRITDIISEINRQMAALKRQAKKAERYNKYQDRIRKLDVRLGLHYYDDYTQQIDETGALLTELQDAEIENTSRLKKIDAVVEKIKYQRLQKNQEISEQKTGKFETQRHIDKMENDLVHLRHDVEQLTAEAAELESSRVDLETKKQNIVQEIGHAEQDKVVTTKALHNATSLLEREKLASQDINNRLSTLNQEHETWRTKLVDLAAQEARYKNICQTATDNKETLKRRLRRADEEAALANKEVADLSRQETIAQEKLASLTQDIDTLAEQVSLAQEKLESKSKALGSQVKLVQTLDFEHNKTKSKYTALKKMEDNFEWYKDGVKAIMKKNKAAEVSRQELSNDQDETQNKDGIMGLMADIITPEPFYEFAVEAALGEALQYIIVNAPETALNAIDYLQTNDAGRSGFIPVSSLKQVEGVPPQSSDPQQRLLNHVSIQSGFEGVAEALLGHVVAVTDIEEAVRLFSSNHQAQTIVTQNGDIISPQGIMIGGSKEKLSGILAKKKELKDTKNRIKTLYQKLESAHQDQKQLESDMRLAESSMQKLIEQKNETVHNKTEAEKNLFKIIESLKHARRRLEIVGLEQEQLLCEESDIDEELTKYNRAVVEIENKIQEAKNKGTEISKQVGSISAEAEKHNRNIVDFKLKLTSLNAKLENSNNNLRRLKEFLGDGTRQIEQLTQNIALKVQKTEAAKQKIIEYEQALSGMYEKNKNLEQAIENNEANYHAIEADLHNNENKILEIKTKSEDTAQKIRLLELEQSQMHIKRENIANRLKEKYHQSITEFRAETESAPGVREITMDEMENELSLVRRKIAHINDVNLGAIKEYEQLKTRCDFLLEQRDDLVKAVEDLHKVIKKINRITQERFLKTFDAINEKIKEVFPRLFEGGSAKLVLTHPDQPLETGVEFMIHPPGKKLTRLSLLSGGEKALSAIALIFSIFLIKPSTFCLMDEIDASLDDINLYRFNNLMQMIGEKSQIIMITHNKGSMEFAKMLLGVTMEKRGVSKIVSVNFERIEEQKYGT